VFVDQVTISVESGAGGSGRVSFRREKYVPKGGPDGGTGGNGGHVLLCADQQLHTLLDHRYRRIYKADPGQPGSTSRKTGKNGKDLMVRVPQGTLVRDAATGELLADLVEAGQECRIARGGKGGRGNSEFATSTQQTPRHAESGRPGEQRSLVLELKLIADVGLVGSPNAGKSTLISVISAAKPKIADYPFTTLEPNLGIVRYQEYKSFTVADIPGLIEGAHEGKGLGTRFLRHIERTRILVVLIDCRNEDYGQELGMLRSELEKYSRELVEKPKFIVFTKQDTANEEILERITAFEKTEEENVVNISSVSGEGLKALLDRMWQFLETERKQGN